MPATEIFTGNEYIGVNRKLKINFIPDDVVAQINEALKKEENPYLKYGIIILQSTGMRIGDLLKLRIDCIKPHLISGYTIEWTQHKGRKDKAPMPVRSECVAAIEKLIEVTSELRNEADGKDKDTLMIHRIPKGIGAGSVSVITTKTFTTNWFRDFIKRNNIKDANGNYYKLTSHQFRRTLGTDMLSKGTNINVIQQVLGHSDPSVTKRFYADVKDKERAEVFKDVGVIGNINQIQSSVLIMYQSLNGLRLIKISVLQGYVMATARSLLQMETSVRDFLKDRNATLAVGISQHRNTWMLINSIWQTLKNSLKKVLSMVSITQNTLYRP